VIECYKRLYYDQLLDEEKRQVEPVKAFWEGLVKSFEASQAGLDGGLRAWVYTILSKDRPYGTYPTAGRLGLAWAVGGLEVQWAWDFGAILLRVRSGKGYLLRETEVPAELIPVYQRLKREVPET
jgi:hypothetical protein